MENYTLYLDESIVNNHPNNMRYLVLGGIIVNSNKIINIEKQVNTLKEDIWINNVDFIWKKVNCEQCNKKTKAYCYKWKTFDENNININDIIFHDTDVRNNSKHDVKCYNDPHYQIFKKFKYKKKYGQGISNILVNESNDIQILGVGIDNLKVEEIYKYPYSSQDISYNYLFKEIIKRYTRFLIEKEAKGNIIMESRSNGEEKNPRNSMDQIIIDKYYKILGSGTDLIDSKVLQDKLMGINLIDKKDNNLLLQLADSIPNHIGRTFCKLPKQEFMNRDNIQHLYWNSHLNNIELNGVAKIY